VDDLEHPIHGEGIVDVLRAKVLELVIKAHTAAREVEQADWLVIATELALNLWLSSAHLAWLSQ
jgi:selenophosphate synthase